MSHTITFDTLAFVKELETAGITATQAEAQARALANALNQAEESQLEELATKGDISDIKLQIKELELKIAEIKTETIKWVAGLLLVQSGIVIGTMFALFRLFIPG